MSTGRFRGAPRQWPGGMEAKHQTWFQPIRFLTFNTDLGLEQQSYNFLLNNDLTEYESTSPRILSKAGNVEGSFRLVGMGICAFKSKNNLMAEFSISKTSVSVLQERFFSSELADVATSPCQYALYKPEACTVQQVVISNTLSNSHSCSQQFRPVLSFNISTWFGASQYRSVRPSIFLWTISAEFC